jgi:hypothetical protein
MKDSVYKWLVVAMLWVICLFNYADRMAIASVFPLLQSEFRSFVGRAEIPMRHGKTIGELTHYLNSTMQLEANVMVWLTLDWQRSMLWDDTGLTWVAPSPNLPRIAGVQLPDFFLGNRGFQFFHFSSLMPKFRTHRPASSSGSGGGIPSTCSLW